MAPNNVLATVADSFVSTIHCHSYPFISTAPDPILSSISSPSSAHGHPFAHAASHPRRVLIVGASRGIGRAIAQSYAQALVSRGGASHLALASRPGPNLSATAADMRAAAAKSRGDNSSADAIHVLEVGMDVSSPASVQEAAARLEKEWGKLDVVVACAGIMETHKLLAESEPDEWWRTFEVNLRGVYNVARYCHGLLERGAAESEGRGAALAYISSVGAFVENPTPTLSAYQPSKLAAQRVIEFYNRENKDKGIVAFGIHPGNNITDIVGGEEGLRPEIRALFTETPDLVGDTLVFLTREKREWIGGRYLDCKWDMKQLLERKDEIVSKDLLRTAVKVD